MIQHQNEVNMNDNFLSEAIEGKPRRKIAVNFDHQLPPDQMITDLSDKIKEEIPMLLNHLSDMTQDDCKNLLDDQTHP